TQAEQACDPISPSPWLRRNQSASQPRPGQKRQKGKWLNRREPVSSCHKCPPKKRLAQVCCRLPELGLAKVSASAGSRCHLEPMLPAKEVNSIHLQANQSRHVRLPPRKRGEPGAGKRRAVTRRSYLICPETSLVISNMLTCPLPLKTGRSASSALIWVRFFLS